MLEKSKLFKRLKVLEEEEFDLKVFQLAVK